MRDMRKYLDQYELKARVYPALLVILPLAVAISIEFPELYTTLAGLVVLFVTFGGLYLLAQVGRDAGKKLEPELYLKWGGLPSVVIFRYQDKTIPRPTKEVLHKALSKATGTAPPTAKEELNHPSAVDEIYRTWSDFLRKNTRDTETFNLLFKETINFGFRRNTLGLKVFYSISGVISLLILLLPFEAISQVKVGAMLVIALYTLFFLLRVNEGWVKIVALEYAKRLVEAYDGL